MTDAAGALLEAAPTHLRLLRLLGRGLRRAVPAPRLASVLRFTMPLRRGNVAMFHVGRSGSTVLGGLLNQHPAVFWDGELFEGYYGADEQARREQGLNTAFRWNRSPFFPGDPVGFVRSRMPLAGFKSFYGFETKFYHLRFNQKTVTDYITSLDRLGFSHYLVLERRNLLRVVISAMVGRQTGVFHRAMVRKASLTRIRLDPRCVDIDSESKPLLAYLRDWSHQFESLRELLAGRRTLWMSYEDDISNDPLVAYRRCCSFLGIRPYQVSVRLTRTNPFPLSEVIVNWDEVADELAGTGFEWMLRDADAGHWDKPSSERSMG